MSTLALCGGPVGGPVMEGKRTIIALTCALLILAACEAPSPPPETHPQWVIRSRVAFLANDLTTAREPLPLSAFRLTFPYITGDLYGSANIGDFIHPVLNSDYTFEVDLNRTQNDLVHSLQQTEFNYLAFLKIDPPEARIARLTPLALKADGIEQVATSDWVDPSSNERLMLVYVDRPARITGALTRNGHTTRYNIRASKAGYVWIGCIETPDGEMMFTEVERPEKLILALTPPEAAELPRGHHDDSLRPDEASAGQSASSAAAAQPAKDPRGLDALRSSTDLRGADGPRRAASRARTELPDR
jgi:hypothetical protein